LRIKRAKRDRWILGVCGGIAHTCGWSSNVLRLVAVLVTIFAPGPGWVVPIAYLLGGAILPESGEF
jgi:phage shock protein C